MELEYSVWQISIIALVAGILIGALAYRFFAPTVKQADKVKSELDSARQELDNYKEGVSQHFDKTGELVNELAQNYVKVYKHLSEGAQTLAAGKTFPELLEQQGKESEQLEGESEVVSEVVDETASTSEEVEEAHEPTDYVVDSPVEEVVEEVKEPVEVAESSENDESSNKDESVENNGSSENKESGESDGERNKVTDK